MSKPTPSIEPSGWKGSRGCARWFFIGLIALMAVSMVLSTLRWGY